MSLVYSRLTVYLCTSLNCCFIYRRNVTICIDSNQSNWIYIVKTGQCRILKDVELKPKHLKSTVKTHRPKTEFQYYFDSSKHHEKSKVS